MSCVCHWVSRQMAFSLNMHQHLRWKWLFRIENNSQRNSQWLNFPFRNKLKFSPRNNKMYWKGYNSHNFIGFLNPSSLIRRHVKNCEKSPQTIVVGFFFFLVVGWGWNCWLVQIIMQRIINYKNSVNSLGLLLTISIT